MAHDIGIAPRDRKKEHACSVPVGRPDFCADASLICAEAHTVAGMRSADFRNNEFA